jgi:(E)-4-hydroxy-3-methylbut-2-enyl-diphosphate synthase
MAKAIEKQQEIYNSNLLQVGPVVIGGNSPLSVQTMWKTPLIDPHTPLDRLRFLRRIGCDLVRFAVPNETTAQLLGELSHNSPMPIIADIHFQHTLALLVMDYRIPKIRINPGNIGAPWKVHEVLAKAKETGTVIRIGINAGSLPKKRRKREDRVTAMLESAEEELEILEKEGFSNAVFSLKSSNVEETVEANRRFAKKYNYPLHIGITEAGPAVPGIVKNSVGIYRLLSMGIGDTIRVSLSDSMEMEVETANEILQVSGKRKEMIRIISCPRCGRATFDTHKALEKIYPVIQTIRKAKKIAVMGCIVNGPEEAKHADLGITGTGEKVTIFREGNVIATLPVKRGMEEFIRLIRELE